jgi:hypothetical protein
MKDDNKTQKLLEKLSPKPLSPEIKEKILMRSYQRKNKFQLVTPALRWVFAGSCVLIAMAFVFDTAIKNSEKSRLTAMMDGSKATEILRDQELQDMIRDLFKIKNDQNLGRWLIRHQKTERKTAKLLDYQRLMDILKE